MTLAIKCYQAGTPRSPFLDAHGGAQAEPAIAELRGDVPIENQTCPFCMQPASGHEVVNAAELPVEVGDDDDPSMPSRPLGDAR